MPLSWRFCYALISSHAFFSRDATCTIGLELGTDTDLNLVGIDHEYWGLLVPPPVYFDRNRFEYCLCCSLVGILQTCTWASQAVGSSTSQTKQHWPWPQTVHKVCYEVCLWPIATSVPQLKQHFCYQLSQNYCRVCRTNLGALSDRHMLRSCCGW